MKEACVSSLKKSKADNSKPQIQHKQQDHGPTKEHNNNMKKNPFDFRGVGVMTFNPGRNK